MVNKANNKTSIFKYFLPLEILGCHRKLACKCLQGFDWIKS